jgi:DNA-binding transcriptional LysR family regulator
MIRFITCMNLSAIDLNLLLVLHTVLEEQSVARAAEKLSVTSSAVSNSLARLRAALDDALLVRRGRRLTPTPRALELASPLKTALGTLTQALDAGFHPATTRRRFTLALSEVDQACSAPEIAAALTRRMPQAGLQIVNLDTMAATDGLSTGAIDAAMVSTPSVPTEPGMHAMVLYEEEAALVVRQAHPAVRRGRISAEQFNALRHVDTWIVLGRPSRGHPFAEAFLARHGLRRDIALVVPNYLTAAMVVAASDLLSAVPRRLAERFRTMLPVQIIPLPSASLQYQQHLIWHERTHRDPGSLAFRELVREAMRGPWQPALKSTPGRKLRRGHAEPLLGGASSGIRPRG